jgi:lipopolysaccharide heptosyltransferase I
MHSLRILIVKLSSIGDVVHALPALTTLRTYYPNAYIAWAVEENAFDILVGNPDLNEIILVERKKMSRWFKTGHWLNGWKEITKLKQRLRSKQFDISIDLQGLARSAFIVYLANAKKKIGCYEMRELSYVFSAPSHSKIRNPQSTIRNSTPVHAVDRSLIALQALDKNIKPLIGFPILLTDAEHQFAKDFLRQNQIAETETLIGINLGASNPLKLWQQEKFAALIDQLINKEHYRVILLGGPSDRSFAKGVCSLLNSNPFDAVGKTSLKQLAALTQHCDIVVSGDTAPLHIAAAMGTPVVAIFGPGDPNRTGPYPDKKIILWKNLECSPCFQKKKCNYKLKCMQQITVEEVITAIQNLLNG